MSKYLTNNKTTSTNRPLSTHTVTEVTEEDRITAATSRTSSPISNTTQAGISSPNKTYQSGLPQTSGLSGSTSYMRQFNSSPTQTPNLLNNYALQNTPQSNISSDELARKLDDITKQLNSLQQKMNSSGNSQSPAPSVTTNRFVNTASPLDIYSSSDMYQEPSPGLSGGYTRSNTNPIPYQPGIDSSSAQMSMQDYDLSNYANSRPQQPSYNSLDEIKAKLDGVS